jgi:hypothetical protein
LHSIIRKKRKSDKPLKEKKERKVLKPNNLINPWKENKERKVLKPTNNNNMILDNNKDASIEITQSVLKNVSTSSKQSFQSVISL